MSRVASWEPGSGMWVAVDGGCVSWGDHRRMEFVDRRDAGRELGARLLAFAAERPIVITLPRGGVSVAVDRDGRQRIDLRGRAVIVVDDGLATGPDRRRGGAFAAGGRRHANRRRGSGCARRWRRRRGG
jgi:hypothetical protein